MDQLTTATSFIALSGLTGFSILFYRGEVYDKVHNIAKCLKLGVVSIYSDLKGTVKTVYSDTKSATIYVAKSDLGGIIGVAGVLVAFFYSLGYGFCLGETHTTKLRIREYGAGLHNVTNTITA